MVFVLNRYLDDGKTVDVYPDVFEDMCEWLAEGKPFAFSRFGDAEFAAMLEFSESHDQGESSPFPSTKEAMAAVGLRSRSMDGHDFFPDLGARLREIVDSQPDYLMGLGLAVRLLFGELWIKSRIPNANRIDWVSANCFVIALIAGNFGRLLDALHDRRVVLVGPPHLERLATSRSWAYVEVERQNCWTHYPEVKDRLDGMAATGADTVFVFCATMMSNVLIDDLYKLNSTNTYLDAGSVLDPYAGVNSRKFHKELKLSHPSVT